MNNPFAELVLFCSTPRPFQVNSPNTTNRYVWVDVASTGVRILDRRLDSSGMARFVLTNQKKHDPPNFLFVGPEMEGLMSNDDITLKLL